MNVIRLKADLEAGYGRITVPNGFKELDPMMRKDLLKCWISELQNLYDSFDTCGNPIIGLGGDEGPSFVVEVDA